MATGDYRQVITFQKRTLTMNDEGTEVEVWSDFYKCHAYVNNARPGTSGISSETYGGDIKRENINDIVLFAVRYCKKVVEVNPYDFQIVFGGRAYSLTSIADDVKYIHQEVRFRGVAKDV